MRIAAAPSERAADAEWTRFLAPDTKRSLLRPELRAGGPDLAPLLISDQLAGLVPDTCNAVSPTTSAAVSPTPSCSSTTSSG